MVFLRMEDGYPRYKMQMTTFTWPATAGTVLHSRVIQRQERARYGAQGKGQTFWFAMRWTEIDEAYFGQSSRWIDSVPAHKEARRYLAGDSVSVHYFPDDPSIATIETDYEWVNVPFLWFLMLQFFALLSLYSSLEQQWRFIKSRLRS